MTWRCERCGAVHESNDPPCRECGHEWFEKETEVVESTGGHVWVCTECGRSHVKNSPPCSRCGNHEFERRAEESYGADETTAPGYLDLAGPGYLLAAGVAVVLLAALVLVVLGVVPLPAVLGGPPSVSGVPGNATEAAGISLADAEAATVAAVNDRRAELNRSALTREETLDAMATYYNRKRVKADYADGERPDAGGLAGRFGYSCDRGLGGATHPNGGSTSVESVDSAGELGASLAETVYASGVGSGPDQREIGLDVHVAPDGTVYATAFVC